MENIVYLYVATACNLVIVNYASGEGVPVGLVTLSPGLT